MKKIFALLALVMFIGATGVKAFTHTENASPHKHEFVIKKVDVQDVDYILNEHIFITPVWSWVKVPYFKMAKTPIIEKKFYSMARPPNYNRCRC